MSRSRWWRLVPLVAVLVAVLELVVFVLLGRLVGFGWVVVALGVTSAAGLMLLRREGVRAGRGFLAAIRASQPPGDQVLDGLVGLAAGLLLAVPGLLSAAAGMLLVLAPVRRLARQGIRVAVERRMGSAAAGAVFGPRRVRVYRGAPRPYAGGAESAADRQPIVGEVVTPVRH